MIQKRFKSTRVGNRQCFFCQNKTAPDYKEVTVLERFVSDRGKIVSRNRTGICAKHQRQLAQQIKRARFLALLPFTAKV